MPEPSVVHLIDHLWSAPPGTLVWGFGSLAALAAAAVHLAGGRRAAAAGAVAVIVALALAPTLIGVLAAVVGTVTAGLAGTQPAPPTGLIGVDAGLFRLASMAVLAGILAAAAWWDGRRPQATDGATS